MTRKTRKWRKMTFWSWSRRDNPLTNKKQTFIYSSFLDFWNKMYVTSSQLTLIKVNKSSCRFAFGMFRYTTHYYTLSPSAMVGRLYWTIQEMDIFLFNKKKCLCSVTASWFNFKVLFSFNFKKELFIREFFVDSKKFNSFNRFVFIQDPYQTICILKLILKYLKCIFSIWTLFSCILILFDKKI